jgi:uncharacterized protein with GYD domain
MAKYLIKVSYSAEGLHGVRKEGAAARAAFIAQMLETVGGSLEAFYFAFGPDDVILIADVPDNKTALALAATIGASDAISTYETVPLLTTQEVDAAMKISVGYRAPGT